MMHAKAPAKPVFFHLQSIDYLSAEFSSKDGEEYARMYADFQEFSEKILMPLTYVPAVPPIDQVQTLDNAKDDAGRRFNEKENHQPKPTV